MSHIEQSLGICKQPRLHIWLAQPLYKMYKRRVFLATRRATIRKRASEHLKIYLQSDPSNLTDYLNSPTTVGTQQRTLSRSNSTTLALLERLLGVKRLVPKLRTSEIGDTFWKKTLNWATKGTHPQQY